LKRLLRLWRDMSVLAKGLLLLSFPLLLMLGALLSGWQLNAQVADAEAEARRTLEVQSELQSLHKLIVEAATGVRGYLLTGRDDFLQTYWRADGEIPTTLLRLDSITRDAGQREVLSRLRPQIQAKLASLDELRTTGRLLSPDELQQHLIDSKRLLDGVRSDLEVMQRREAELVEERTAAVAIALRRNLLMNAVTVGVALVISMLAAAVFYTSIASRVGRIALNAERMLRGQSLLTLPPATDELGQLMARLQQAAALLAQRAEESQGASRAKTEFLSRVSHELRTPLNAILGFAQLLESDQTSLADRRAVAQILAAGRHLLSLINELIDISRIESGQMPLAAEGVAIAPLLDEVSSMSAVLARQAGVVVAQRPFDPRISVLADRQRLMQVLLNLVSNAIKYNRTSGHVWLSATAQGDHVEVDVVDDGPGIPLELRTRLFQPFERLHAGAQDAEGSGLGLAIARLLARAMGGDLVLQPGEGTGCRFTVRLPAAGAQAVGSIRTPSQEGMSRAAAMEATPASSRDVLLVEDNASNRALVEALMARRPGWRLHVAITAREAIEMVEALRPELILLDLHLPDGSGEGVLASLQESSVTGSSRVVILTADALPGTRERLLAAGADDFLTKPLDVARFYAVLEGAA